MPVKASVLGMARQVPEPDHRDGWAEFVTCGKGATAAEALATVFLSEWNPFEGRRDQGEYPSPKPIEASASCRPVRCAAPRSEMNLGIAGRELVGAGLGAIAMTTPVALDPNHGDRILRGSDIHAAVEFRDVPRGFGAIPKSLTDFSNSHAEAAVEVDERVFRPKPLSDGFTGNDLP